jgi:hypothetical protein
MLADEVFLGSNQEFATVVINDRNPIGAALTLKKCAIFRFLFFSVDSGLDRRARTFAQGPLFITQ